MTNRTPDAGRQSARRLARAVRETARALLPRRRAAPPSGDREARLDYLERELAEVRTRVNALFFAVLGVALGELVGRVVAA